MTESNRTPPGWYPDPNAAGYQRYWDGSAWTDQQHPITLTMNAPADAGSPAPAPTTSNGLPWWQTWWAVILGLLLCFPFGLVGLWKRPGVTTKVRWWVTGATAALLVIAFATQSNASTPSNQNADVPPPVSQSPTTATISPALVVVPKLTGLSRTRARATLTALGMTVGQISKQASRRPAGTILSQSDAAGTQVQAGSAEDLVIASPLPHVPNVIGRTKTEATQRLRSAGFSVGITTRSVTQGPNGVVLTENPSGGTAAMPGTRVQIVVSVLKAPPPTQAPAVPQGCTTTSSGSCIRGGEFCPQADYGSVGYDANGTPYTCTGDQTHPHWE
ncbi:MAG: serine/threonine protein kinase [Marmoricola sp.]|nr:serine/threonine protein kinase [Marmoricola sp.]